MSGSVFLYEPFYEIDRLFDHVFGNNNTGGAPANRGARSRALENGDSAVRSLKPRMDLHENTATNTVTATFELPGLAKSDVQLDVHNGRLTVTAESQASAEHAESGYAVRERRFGKFARVLQLPQGVKEDEIKATMENGVLSVTFPKTVAEMAPKKIEIA